MVYVMIRISLDGDTGSNVRNTVIAATLQPYGFTNTKTGTWEATIEEPRALEAISFLSGRLQDARSRTPDIIDHVWIMIDKDESM